MGRWDVIILEHSCYRLWKRLFRTHTPATKLIPMGYSNWRGSNPHRPARFTALDQPKMIERKADYNAIRQNNQNVQHVFLHLESDSLCLRHSLQTHRRCCRLLNCVYRRIFFSASTPSIVARMTLDFPAKNFREF